MDNLKLGYGGTKTEMERLLADAEKLSGVHYDISNLGDVFNAIHVIQTELGITGTTAKEASTTIEGSVKAVAAAWQNLVVGFARSDADIDGLITALVDNAEIAFNNILPVAEKALSGIGDFVKKIAPIIGEKLPDLIVELAPDLLDAGVGFVEGLAEGILNGIPTIAEKIKNKIGEIFGISDEIDTFISDISTAFEEGFAPIGDAFTHLQEALQPLQEAIQPLIDGFNDWVESGQALDDISNVITTTIETLEAAIAVVVETVADIVDGITSFVEWLNSGNDAAEALKTVVVTLTTAFVAYKTALAIGTLIDTVKTAMLALRDATILEQIAQAALNLVMSLNPIGLIIAAISALVAAFLYLWNTNEDFRNFWIGLWDKIVEVFSGAVNGIVKFFKETLPNAINDFVNKAKSFGENLVKGFGEGITKMLTWIKDKVKGFGQSVLDAIKNFFGIHSPSTAFADIGENLIKGLWNGISNMAKWISDKIKGFGEGVLSGIKKFFGIESPSKVMRDVVGKNLALGIVEGIEKNENAVVSTAESLSKNLGDAFSDTYSIDAAVNGISTSAVPVSDNIQTISSVEDIPNILNNSTQTGSGNMTVILELDGQQFAKAVYRYNNDETQRVGLKLSKGVT